MKKKRRFKLPEPFGIEIVIFPKSERRIVKTFTRGNRKNVLPGS